MKCGESLRRERERETQRRRGCSIPGERGTRRRSGDGVGIRKSFQGGKRGLKNRFGASKKQEIDTSSLDGKYRKVRAELGRRGRGVFFLKRVG